MSSHSMDHGDPNDPNALFDDVDDLVDASEEDVELDDDHKPAARKVPPTPSEMIRTLQEQNEDLKDRLIRTVAEMENLRKRTQKDVADAKSYAMSSFARDMLEVGDNMRRTVGAAPTESEDPGLKTLIEGIEMTERGMLNTFERHGIKKVEPQGEKFDPNYHQAMYEIENPDVPSGTVLQVVAPGYVIGGRMLRPAMVGVSKGGPKPGMATGAGIDESA